MLPTVKKNSTPAPGVFRRAGKRFAAKRRPVRLGFLIDATGSRGDSWEKAQGIQAGMFRAASGLGPLSLRLVHYGGGELADHGWIDNPREAAAAMARVRCESGLTKIVLGLNAFRYYPPEERAAAIILVGDCFEEDPRDAEQMAFKLKQEGIRVFCFHEGEDWTAEGVFRRIAEITGGKFARFGDGLPLAELCEGVALLAAGGAKALKRLPDGRAKQLLLTGPDAKEKAR